MKNALQSFLKVIPSIFISLLLAIIVWIIAESQQDPAVERRFPNNITTEIIGLADGLVMTNTIPEVANLHLRAPESVWNAIVNDRIDAKATIDVTGLTTGKHELPLKITVDAKPIYITAYSPQTVEINLEEYQTREFDVRVTEVGEIPTAFKGEVPVVNPKTVSVSGPVSKLDEIDFLRVVLNHSNATETIVRDLSVGAINKSGNAIGTGVNGLSFDPEQVNVSQGISLRGGYRVVVVKVVTEGTVPNGYQVSKIGVSPTVVTIYSSDRTLLESLPSYVETDPILLSEYTGNASINIGLDLPQGVSLVGDQSVKVDVQISAIMSTMTYSDIPVYVIGLADGQSALLSPEMVDIYLSGPQPILNTVRAEELYAIIDLTNTAAGHYQLTPEVDLASWDGLSVQSINPTTIDVAVTGNSITVENTPATLPTSNP